MLLSCLEFMGCSGWVTDGTPDWLKGCVQALPFGEQRLGWSMSCFTMWIQSNLTYNTRQKTKTKDLSSTLIAGDGDRE